MDYEKVYDKYWKDIDKAISIYERIMLHQKFLVKHLKSDWSKKELRIIGANYKGTHTIYDVLAEKYRLAKLICKINSKVYRDDDFQQGFLARRYELSIDADMSVEELFQVQKEVEEIIITFSDMCKQIDVINL